MSAAALAETSVRSLADGCIVLCYYSDSFSSPSFLLLSNLTSASSSSSSSFSLLLCPYICSVLYIHLFVDRLFNIRYFILVFLRSFSSVPLYPFPFLCSSSSVPLYSVSYSFFLRFLLLVFCLLRLLLSLSFLFYPLHVFRLLNSFPPASNSLFCVLSSYVTTSVVASSFPLLAEL